MTHVDKPEWSRLFGDGPPAGTPTPAPPKPAPVLADEPPPMDWSDVNPPNGAGPATTTPPAWRPYEATDDSNARRLVDAHPDDIRYCPERRQWLTWDGHRWRWDHAGILVEHARAIADGLPKDERWKAWRKKSLMQPRLAAMVGLARSDPRIVAHAHTLDRRAEQLNTPAGVIDLRTGQLRAPDPAALHTRSTAVAPDLDATPRRWLDFLADTFAGQPELTTYVHRLLGVSLVGQVVEQLFPVCHGLGRNGKGVLFKVVQDLLGIGDEGYSAQAATELIVATRYPGHPTEIARLNGARLVVTSEVEEGQRFAEARLKLLTGGDVLNARFMGKDFFDFEPTHTLWLLANDQPRVTTGGYALWQRIRLIPFEHIVPPEKRNKHLAAELVAAEGPAILGWLIAGAADYYAHGLGEPAAVTAATQAYEHDQDTISRFVDERCITGETNRPDLVIRSSALYGEYEKWCAEQGEEKRTHKAFTGALKAQHGVVTQPTRTGVFYHGIRLDQIETDEQPPLPDEPPEPAEQELPWPGYPNTPGPDDEKGDSRW
jgi:putative DNA primase/helicase